MVRKKDVFFKSIKIDGFRGRHFELKVPEGQKHAVFVMNSGTGKTITIELLKWCFSYPESEAIGKFRHRWHNPAHILDMYKETEQNCDIIIEFSGPENEFVFTRSVTGKFDKNQVSNPETKGDVIDNLVDTLEISSGKTLKGDDVYEYLKENFGLTQSADYCFFDGDKARDIVVMAQSRVPELITEIERRADSSKIEAWISQIDNLIENLIGDTKKKASNLKDRTMKMAANTFTKLSNTKAKMEKDQKTMEKEVLNLESEISKLVTKITDRTNENRENFRAYYRSRSIHACLNDDPATCTLCGQELDKAAIARLKSQEKELVGKKGNKKSGSSGDGKIKIHDISSLRNKLTKLNIDKGILLEKLRHYNPQIEELDEKIDVAGEKLTFLEERKPMMKLLEDTKKMLKVEKDQISKKIISAVSEVITKAVRNIIGKGYGAHLSAEYGLSFTKNGRAHPELGGYGYNLILAYLFAEAMMQVNTIVVDTPVGNIGEQRTQLAKHLVANHSQVILLCLKEEIIEFAPVFTSIQVPIVNKDAK
jgi:hypothetical protein